MTKTHHLKKRFQFLSEIATADIAFEAYGSSYSELFVNSGIALETVQVDISTLKSNETKLIEFKSFKLEKILYYFLNELVYLKDSEKFLAKKIDCELQKQEKKWFLKVKLYGERINRLKHNLGNDVKAVTLHKFKIGKQENGRYYSRVILDV